jgi:hypothetical protein
MAIFMARHRGEFSLDERESLIGFVEAGLRSHADGCDASRQWVTWKAGSFERSSEIEELAVS